MRSFDFTRDRPFDVAQGRPETGEHGNAENPGAIRELRLRRRRSRMPWVYLVYQVRHRLPAAASAKAGLTLATEERRHIERRRLLERIAVG